MTTSPTPRWIELEGAANARDVGGLPTVDGRTTRPGVLLRSANLTRLTADDVRRLRDELGLTAVLDMRTDSERAAEGPGPLAQLVDHHHLTLLPQLDTESDEVAAALPVDHRRGDYSNMASHYVGYVEDGRDNLATALRLIAEATGPVLVHCAAGKDRTGTVVALALELSGVTRDAVVADYAATDVAMEDVHASLMLSELYSKNLRDVPVDELRPKAESMARFLDHVDTAYGGAHGLAMSIGVDEETIAKLVARLVGTRA